MSVFNIEEFLNSKNIEFKGPNKRGFLTMECLYCGSKGKLNVCVSHDDSKASYGFAKCYKCGEPGGFHKIIATLNSIPEEEALVVFKGERVLKKESDSPFAIDTAPAIEIISQKVKKELGIAKLPEVIMPLGVDPDDDCLKYINKRGLSLGDFKKIEAVYVPHDLKTIYDLIGSKYKNEIDKLKAENLINDFKELFFVKEPFTEREEKIISKIKKIDTNILHTCRETLRLRGRVVFPVKIGTRTLAFVARDITGKSKVKAINSSGSWAASLFWNFNTVRNAPAIVICEGIFSAISCGVDRSIALLGKNISENSDKIRLLKRLGAKTFYIYLDTGAEDEAKELKRLLMNFADEVHIVKIPSVIKTSSRISESDIQTLNNLGVNISAWIRDNTYEISFHHHRTFKIALRLIEGRKIPINDERYLPKAKKIKGLNVELLRLIADGDFLDSNDLGLEFNKKIISEIGFFNCN